MRGDLPDHVWAVAEELCDFGVVVHVRWEEVVAVYDELLEGDLEIAVEEDEGYPVLRVELLPRDHVDCGDGFDEANGPRCVFEDFLVARLEVFDLLLVYAGSGHHPLHNSQAW